MSERVVCVAARLERISINVDPNGVGCRASFQFPTVGSENGWVTMAVTEAEATVLRGHLGKTITFTLEAAARSASKKRTPSHE